ncbi:MAG TPA: polysaccharide deacetylase family protein [Actinomycetota bacterium]
MGRRALLVAGLVVVVMSAAELAAASTSRRASGEDPLPIEIEVVALPNPFSPNGDGRRDEAVIAVTSSAPGSVTVSIQDAAGETWRAWPELPLPEPGSVEVVWRGRAGDVRAPDGRYEVVAAIATEDDASATAAAQLVLDRQPPRLRRLRVRPDPLTTHRRLVIRFVGRDRAPRLRAELRIEDSLGAIGKQGAERPSGSTRVRWRARYRSGKRLYPGNYRLGVRLWDDAGNVSPRRWVPWRVHRNVAGRVYRRLEGTGRRVALTFDDCGNPGAWASILSTLRAKHVEAAFFCGGGAVRGNPALARRTVRDGHTPGSHALDHAILTGHDSSFTSARVRADRRAWWQVARRTSAPYLRPPYGAWNAAVVEGAAAAAAPRVVLWDVNPQDWRSPGAAEIRLRVLSAARPGSIILLHTGDQTAAAVGPIVDGLRARNLEPVGLSALFRAAGMR